MKVAYSKRIYSMSHGTVHELIVLHRIVEKPGIFVKGLNTWYFLQRGSSIDWGT